MCILCIIGNGVFPKRKFSKGEFLLEYAGKTISTLMLTLNLFLTFFMTTLSYCRVLPMLNFKWSMVGVLSFE